MTFSNLLAGEIHIHMADYIIIVKCNDVRINIVTDIKEIVVNPVPLLLMLVLLQEKK